MFTSAIGAQPQSGEASVRAGPIVCLAPSCSIPILYIVYSYSIYAHIHLSSHAWDTHGPITHAARGQRPHVAPSSFPPLAGQKLVSAKQASRELRPRAVLSPPATIPQSPPHIPSHTSILFRPPCARLGVMHAPTRTGNQSEDGDRWVSSMMFRSFGFVN